MHRSSVRLPRFPRDVLPRNLAGGGVVVELDVPHARLQETAWNDSSNIQEQGVVVVYVAF